MTPRPRLHQNGQRTRTVAKCARSQGENVGALGNVAKDANEMCYNSGTLGQSNAKSRRGSAV